MEPLVRFSENFKLAGDTLLNACPVCDSTEIGELWRLPQNRLSHVTHLNAPGSPLHGLYLDYLPTLKSPQEIFKFDICSHCESIFLNPKFDDQAHYAHDTSKVESFRKKGPGEQRGAADSFMRMFPDDTTVVVDAACGAGQLLHLIKIDRPDIRAVGLELSKPSVAFMNGELGIEAHLTDLDRDDLDSVVAPGSVDFIVLQEAFEHVRAPLVVMRKLVRMLRPGGRMHFTAQHYGDNELQIRVGEPIYINDAGLDFVIKALGVELISLKKDIKVRATVEKPGGPPPRAAGSGRGEARSPATPAKPRRARWHRRLWSSIRRRLIVRRPTR